MYCIRWHPNAYLGIENNTSSPIYSTIVTSVRPDTPAEQAGLRPGDHIVTINGQRFDTLEPFYNVVARGQPGDVVTLSVERPGAATPVTLDVTLQPWRAVQRTSLAETLAFEMVGGFPVWFVLVSFPVLFLRLQDRNSWLLALLFSGIIAGGPLFPFEFIIPHALRGFALAYKIIFAGLFSALFNYFFAVFPANSGLDRRIPWLKTVLLAGAATISLPLGLWTLFVGNAFPALRLGVWTLRHEPLHWLTMAYTFGLLPLGLVSLISNGFFAPSADVRRKIRVIVWGTVAGLFPGMILQIAVVFTGKQVPDLFPVWFWAPLTFGSFWLFPLSFAYAVVKHRVLEIPVLLKQSARYLLVKVGYLLLTLAIPTGIIIWLFVTAFTRLFRVPSQLALPVGFAIGVIIGAISARVNLYFRPRVIQRIDRAFFRSVYDVRQVLENLAQKSRKATAREQLAALLRSEIIQALHPIAMTVYFQTTAGELALQHDGTNSSCASALSPSVPLLQELARRAEPYDIPATPDSVHQGDAIFEGFQPECLVPLLAGDGHLTGVLALGSRLSEEPYSREDKRLLASVANQAGLALESIRLAEDIAEHIEAERRASRDMEIAKQVQARLFPQKFPLLHTLEYAGRCIQARHVGGDYYDFLSLGSGRIGIVLADIAGKGIAAALLMANLQADVRSQCAVASQNLPQFLKSVNESFYESTDEGSYATLFFGNYEDSTGRLRFANCGHNPPFLVRPNGTVERLAATATVLGLFAEWESSVCDVQIAAGDVLVIYTDGITEANNSSGEEFGESRLLETIRANLALPVPLILHAVLTAALEFSRSEQSDDLTLVVARGR